MKIANIETYPLLYPLAKPYGDANGYKEYRTCFLFKIVTDSGIEGWGECVDWLPTLVKGFNERIIPYLIGKQATDRTHLVKIIKKWDQRIAAGVSMALTEIVAKSANLSICDLWGGKWRNKIPLYASFQSYSEGQNWMEHSLEQVSKAVNAGFTNVKVKVGGRTFQEDQLHIMKLQNLLEEKVQVALDGNESYDLSTTRQWQPFLSRYTNLMWFEEPMPMDRTEEYALLRSTFSVPLAGGENLKSATKFLPLLRKGAIDIVQPDVMHEDGIYGFRSTLQLARDFGLRVSPHAYDGILSRLYALFALACLPAWSKMEGDDIEPVEWDMMENPFTKLLSIQPVAGSITIPSSIGIGVEMNREMIEKYMWDGSTYY